MLPACSKPLVALCRHPSLPQPYRVAQYAPGMPALGLVAFLPMQLAWLYHRTYLSERSPRQLWQAHVHLSILQLPGERHPMLSRARLQGWQCAHT